MRLFALDIVALAVVGILAVLLGFRQIADGDLFYHVANGREILAQGGLPQINSHVWAVSSRPYYPNPAWLSGVFLALVEGGFGLTGVVLLKTAVVIVLFAALYQICRREGSGPLLSVLLIFFVGMASAFRLNDRPDLFSLLGFAVCLFLLTGREPLGRRNFWLLPLLFALWANLHSGVVLGLLLLGAVLVGEVLDGGWRRRPERVKGLALLLMLCGAASFAVPQPLTNLSFLTQLLEPRSFPISEYLPPTLHGNPWFFAALVLLVVWVSWRRFRPREWRWLVPAGLFLLLAVWSSRFVPFCMFAVLPFILCSVADWRATRKTPRLKLGGTAATLVASLLLISLPVLTALWPPVPSSFGAGADPSVAPMGAVRYLRKVSLAGRLYNSQSYGGVGAMYLAPHYRLYQSTYFQVEKERIEEAYQSSKSSREWQEFLDRHAIEVVWLDTTREPHSAEYYPPVSWALTYFDDYSAVYLRRHGVNRELAAAMELRVVNPQIMADQPDRRSLQHPAVIAAGLAEARRLLEFNPDNRLALALRAFFLVHQPGEEGAALAALDDLERRSPEDRDIHYERGRLLARLGRLSEGEQSLSRYLELAPDDPAGYAELVRIRLAAGEPDRARALLTQMVDRFPEHGEGFLLLGSQQINANELAPALKSLERARELLPDNPEVLNLMGIARAQQGDLDGAIGLFRQALSLDPAFAAARLNLERALRERGERL